MTQPAAGLYEQLITQQVDEQLALLEPELLHRAHLDPHDAHDALARHIAAVARQALRAVAPADDTDRLAAKIALANRMAAAIAELSPDTAGKAEIVTNAKELLTAVSGHNPDGTVAPPPPRPEAPLGISALLVNGSGQPSIGSELKKELASADRVDLICAFITWHGTIVFRDELRDFIQRGGRLRVITTTYLGATHRRAVDLLVELGAEVRISYDTRHTRLHAKAWLLRRETGFDTAYVGSSNLSQVALTTGLEWNVRLSAIEQPHLIKTFEETFDEYWASPDFASYLPDRDSELLDEALAEERGGGRLSKPGVISPLEVRPYGYQQEILDELLAEREVHGRFHNLVVMATGTGKTVVAGLDYLRGRRQKRVESLLFVAHREEILDQSLRTFQQILRDGSFGELLVHGARPTRWKHVFASIQSLDRLELDPEHFDMVIVDEFHHAAAITYRRLLTHLTPKVLLGLTATPERADGQDVASYFGGRISAELRLWEALERGLLAPFQYFGVADQTDLREIIFRRGAGYDSTALAKIYTGNEARVGIIQQAVRDHVLDPRRMRAVGFCVSVAHAQYMTQRFRDAGIEAAAVTSATGDRERRVALQRLADRSINILFTVDLFNEGIDLPEIDTILLLRPTESVTVFLQQLGRGLRLAKDKPCLTVLDFIGAQHNDFRFDLRFRALTGVNRRDLQDEVERGFPSLPAGCSISLDRVAAKAVLDNVRQSLRIRWNELAAELRISPALSLPEFLDRTGVDLPDIYRAGKGGWTALRRMAQVDQQPAGPRDAQLGRAFGRMLHTDDLERLAFWEWLLEQDQPVAPAQFSAREFRLARMLQTSLYGTQEEPRQVGAAIASLWAHQSRRQELLALTRLLRERIRRVTTPLDNSGSAPPLQIHARYDRYEALRAFGSDARQFNEGVKYIEQERADLFFVTLDKSGRHFSPTTMYADHAITPELFQWESQSTTSAASPTARRYIDHRRLGTAVHLFLRKSPTADGHLGVPAYFYAGRMSYVEHSGSLPVRFIWRLEHPLPADVFHDAKITRG